MTNKSTAPQILDGPAVILIDPQMGENIGAAARAMLNNSLGDLRIVRPRDGWPSETAYAMSSGALDLMPPIKVFDTLADAATDCQFLYATTARPRDMMKPVFTGKEAALDMHKRQRKNQKIGLVFGAERAGLTNEDISLCHAIIQIPLNPGFSSLNLGQAVLLTTYEWYQAQDNTDGYQPAEGDSPLASHGELNELYERLESELEKHHFFRSEGLRPTMMRNIRNMLGRAEFTEQETRTFQGIISALIGNKTPK